MTLILQSACCRRLGIDPKTLRSWLSQAQMAWTPHPSDARQKGITDQQLQQLAAIHQRPLLSEHSLALGSPSEEWPVPPMGALLAQIVQLNQHLVALTQEIQSWRREQAQAIHRPPVPPQHSSPVRSPSGSSPSSAVLSPTERSRARPIPLIAATATGTYVLICPTRGELPFAPDSADWFAWLEGLSSFRFVGQQGRLSASRHRGRPGWMAYRRIHGHCYCYGLGNTKRLTIAHLEQMAATLQSHMPSC
jgi:hypothetical protein